MKFSSIVKLSSLISIAAVIFFSCEKDLEDATTWISPTFHSSSHSADTVKLTVFSIFDWEVVIDEDVDWLTTDTKGVQLPADQDSVMVYIARNRSRNTRKTTLNIKFSDDGYSDRTLDITQNGVEDMIEITTEDIRIAKIRTDIEILLDTNIEWEVVSPPAWIENIQKTKVSYDDKTGMDSYKITANVTENILPYYRLDSLKLKGTTGPEGSDASSVINYISIFQDGNSSLKTDSTNLRRLYENTNGAGWKTGWDLSKPLTQWHGVGLDSVAVSVGKEYRVVSLNLKANNLTGTIPSDLFNTPFMKRLWLNNNNISGNLPTNLSYIVDLENLNLNNNSELQGTLLEDIGKLVNMISFSIANTSMSGTLPEGFAKQEKLTFLDLGGNNFSGLPPASLGNNDELTDVFFKNNMFSGAIPETYKKNMNWFNWNVTDYVCPQKPGYGFTNCSEF